MIRPRISHTTKNLHMILSNLSVGKAFDRDFTLAAPRGRRGGSALRAAEARGAEPVGLVQQRPGGVEGGRDKERSVVASSLLSGGSFGARDIFACGWDGNTGSKSVRQIGFLFLLSPYPTTCTLRARSLAVRGCGLPFVYVASFIYYWTQAPKRITKL